MNIDKITKWSALKLTAICVFIFILQILIPNLTTNFALVSAFILSKPWTLLTSVFLHGDFQHLFYNMFALALFGTILERIISGRKFLILFFVSGLIASIGAAIFYPAAIGASGAIFGILGALTVLRPKMIVYFGFFPMPMALAAVFWAAGDLIGMFAPSGVANAAHLFGLAFGLIYGFYIRKEFGHRFFKKKDKVKINEGEFKKWEDKWM